VFDRFGLNGKIGSLCPRYRNETRRGTEEKAFHHLHRDLQVCLAVGGFRSSDAEAPWKVPNRSPRNHPVLFTHLAVGSVDRTGRPGDAPLRRVTNLSQQSCTHNGKTGESQALRRVFRRVLHKWHWNFSLVPTPRNLPPLFGNTARIYDLYQGARETF